MISALITLAATALLVVIDQGIKLWATASLAPVGSMPLIPGVVELRYFLNDGAAFSILGGRQGFLIGFTGIALAAILLYLLFKKPARTLEYLAWVLVLGGGVGNLIDRVLNQEVVDYINLLFMNFAVFNFADILVCTGIGLLCLSLIWEEVRAHKAKKAAGGEQPDGTV